MPDSAILSDCGRYRWRLDRHVGAGQLTAAVFGVNPSTADASLDDATVRKWRGFGQRLGWARFVVGNVFSFRATDVNRLAHEVDPFGPDHLTHIEDIIAEADVLVPCWGNQSKVPRTLRPAMATLSARLMESGKPMMCWGATKSGDPRHPLMIGYDTPLVDFIPG